MENLSLCRKSVFKGRAALLGERIDLRAWGNVDALATSPLSFEVQDGGAAVLFRYGVAVFFDAAPKQELGFLDKLRPCVARPDESPEKEEIEIAVNPDVFKILLSLYQLFFRK